MNVEYKMLIVAGILTIVLGLIVIYLIFELYIGYTQTIEADKLIDQMSCTELKTYHNDELLHRGDPISVNTHGKMMYWTDSTYANKIYTSKC